MDLFCPHCTQKVAVPDDKAGQVMSCPLCAKQFVAPSLAPPATAPKPPAPPPPIPIVPPGEGTYGLGPPPKPPVSPLPPIPEPHKPPAPQESPPVPPGDYTRSCTCCLNANWLAFVAPACVILIFVLTFFPWHTDMQTFPSALRDTETRPAFSFWGLAFTEKGGEGQFLAYAILMMLCIPLTLVALIFDKAWIAAPPPLAPLLTFKNLIVGLLLLLAFSMLCVDGVYANFLERSNPSAFALKIVFRLHLIAVVASFAMFWLDCRKKQNLPLPTMDARW